MEYLVYGFLFVIIISLIFKNYNKENYLETIIIEPTLENYKHTIFVDDNQVCYRYKLECEY